MQKNKAQAYQKILDNPQISEKDKTNVKQKLENHTKERALYKSNVIKAFNENYTFSKLAFIENQHFKSFLEGSTNEVILADSTISDLPSDGNFLLLAKGNHDGQWIVIDDNFKRVASPFPSSFGLGIKKLWDIFLGKKNIDLENQVKLAEKVNKAFNKAYN
ncbi:MAG: hypothetical protein HKN51_06645 [Saprospiraceae bacterium]|nr:hypothetical protein [Bacteroidia bacterium]NNE14636.1 hypothetical protein [Saprospiraceae bacterium]